MARLGEFQVAIRFAPGAGVMVPFRVLKVEVTEENGKFAIKYRLVNSLTGESVDGVTQEQLLKATGLE